MENIHNVNYSPNYNPKVKKKKSKEKFLFKSGIANSDQIDNFDELLTVAETDVYTDEISHDEEKIEYLLKDIGKQGEILKKTKLLQDLNRYKELIKEYLSIILNISEKTENITLWNKSKKQKVTKVHLKIINQELIELTRIFFNEQQNTFKIASQIDKIEGLLIDLKS